MRSFAAVGRAPFTRVRSGHRISRQTVKQFFGKSANDQLTCPIAHAIDPNHQATGGQAAQVVVALQQSHIRAFTGRCRRRRRTRGTTANDQHIAAVIDRDTASFFFPKSVVRALRLLAIAAKNVGHQNPLGRAFGGDDFAVFHEP
jgi:hypothetical protein